jgi:maltose-binding protein MalE
MDYKFINKSTVSGQNAGAVFNALVELDNGVAQLVKTIEQVEAENGVNISIQTKSGSNTTTLEVKIEESS